MRYLKFYSIFLVALIIIAVNIFTGSQPGNKQAILPRCTDNILPFWDSLKGPQNLSISGQSVDYSKLTLSGFIKQISYEYIPGDTILVIKVVEDTLHSSQEVRCLYLGPCDPDVLKLGNTVTVYGSAKIADELKNIVYIKADFIDNYNFLNELTKIGIHGKTIVIVVGMAALIVLFITIKEIRNYEA